MRTKLILLLYTVALQCEASFIDDLVSKTHKRVQDATKSIIGELSQGFGINRHINAPPPPHPDKTYAPDNIEKHGQYDPKPNFPPSPHLNNKYLPANNQYGHEYNSQEYNENGLYTPNHHENPHIDYFNNGHFGNANYFDHPYSTNNNGYFNNQMPGFYEYLNNPMHENHNKPGFGYGNHYENNPSQSYGNNYENRPSHPNYATYDQYKPGQTYRPNNQYNPSPGYRPNNQYNPSPGYRPNHQYNPIQGTLNNHNSQGQGYHNPSQDNYQNVLFTPSPGYNNLPNVHNYPNMNINSGYENNVQTSTEVNEKYTTIYVLKNPDENKTTETPKDVAIPISNNGGAVANPPKGNVDKTKPKPEDDDDEDLAIDIRFKGV